MKECVNCKHSRGIGSDVWCGHEPRGKETYMPTKDTDCPYYEGVEKMTEKRFKEIVSVETILDTKTNNEYKPNILSDELLDLINKLAEENKQLKQFNQKLNDELQEIMGYLALKNGVEKENEQLKSENETYKNIFFEIVETALTDTNCRELYCKGVLDIFDKANSLNQAREMIKEHLK